MALEVRRVITGHDADGKAIVLVDETAKTARPYPGSESAMVWSSKGFPVSNDPASEDEAAEAAARELAVDWQDGSLFWLISFEPGSSGSMHRTDSADYIVVLSGEIDMPLDGGEVVHLRAGDVVVQRGTAHNWVNQGSEPCVAAFVMIDAKPVAGARPTSG